MKGFGINDALMAQSSVEAADTLVRPVPEYFQWAISQESHNIIGMPEKMQEIYFWPFFGIVILLVILTILRRMYDFSVRQFTANAFIMPSSGNFKRAENSSAMFILNVSLYLIFVFVFSLVLFYIIQPQFTREYISPIKLFLLISGCLIAFLLLRNFLIFLLGYVFHAPTFGTAYIRYLAYYEQAVALLLIVPVLFLAYGNFDNELFSYRFFPLLLLGFYIYRTLNFPAAAKGAGKLFYLYILLYLCSLEIIPVLLLIKGLSNWI